MLRVSLALGFSLAIATAGFAADFSIARADEELSDAIHTCDSGENHDGEVVSADTRISRCNDAIQLLIEISTNGYCYNEANDGWRECKVSND